MLQTETGYRVEVVTVRKLEFETDSFAFGDKILARWYPDKSEADKKGILIVVTTAKDGAIIGGPSFLQARIQLAYWQLSACWRTHQNNL